MPDRPAVASFVVRCETRIRDEHVWVYRVLSPALIPARSTMHLEESPLSHPSVPGSFFRSDRKIHPLSVFGGVSSAHAATYLPVIERVNIALGMFSPHFQSHDPDILLFPEDPVPFQITDLSASQTVWNAMPDMPM